MSQTTKITVEHTKDAFKEVRTIWEDKEANDLLASGDWMLMHAGCAHRDAGGFAAKPVFILARVK